MSTLGKRNDYIPANAGEFHEFMSNLLNYAESKSTVWTHIPAGLIDSLRAKYNVFSVAYHTAFASPTPAHNLARNEAKAETTRELRAFVKQYLHFAPVTNVDRLKMGVPNHSTIRTNHIEVHEMVDFLVSPSAIRQLSVDFWIHGADHKAKPSRYDGAVIIWAILENPPSDHSQLVCHALASRTPFKLNFDESERRKKVYLALAWQNARGIKGEWSDIKAAYVP